MTIAPPRPVATVKFLPLYTPPGSSVPPSPEQAVVAVGNTRTVRGTLRNAILKANAQIPASLQAQVVFNTAKAGVYQLSTAYIAKSGALNHLSLDMIGPRLAFTKGAANVAAIVGARTFVTFDEHRKGQAHRISELFTKG